MFDKGLNKPLYLSSAIKIRVQLKECWTISVLLSFSNAFQMLQGKKLKKIDQNLTTPLFFPGEIKFFESLV